MSRQRKGKSTSSKDVPMMRPSEKVKEMKVEKPLIEISEEEQWRLINKSGVLNQIPRPSQQTLDASVDAGDLEDVTFGEEVGNVIFHVVPLSFLLVMMDMCVCHETIQGNPFTYRISFLQLDSLSVQ